MVSIGRVQRLFTSSAIRDALSYLGGGYSRIADDTMSKVYLAFLLVVLLMGIIGPEVTPYPYDAYLYAADGSLLRSAPPSIDHPLGTTHNGHDVFSRLLYGARPTVVTGLLSGLLIIAVGSMIGISAGYFGGRTDEALMRITDFVYSIPLIPFAIVLIAMFSIGSGSLTTVAVIGLVLWRSSARVIRSQVLQLREREYLLSAKATGASDLHIIRKHIFPNVAPMMVLLLSMSIGYAIIVQASLAFIGVVDPFVPSWGVMLRNAYQSGLMGIAWWWSIPPATMISLTVLASFMFGRKFVREDKSSEAMAGGAG
jgi:peptide/nickel transport system permease protein